MAALGRVTDIPGIGSRTGEALAKAGGATVAELRGSEVARVATDSGLPRGLVAALRQLARGRDTAQVGSSFCCFCSCFMCQYPQVRPSGRAASLGLEDRFQRLADLPALRTKLAWLLGRLAGLLEEDGRRPTTLRVSARDLARDGGKFTRMTRQCRVAPRLLASRAEAVEVAVGLLAKMVDLSSFHLTLLGVSVTDFQEEVHTKGAITNFFNKSNKRPEPKLTESTKRPLEASPLSPVFKKARRLAGGEGGERPAAGVALGVGKLFDGAFLKSNIGVKSNIFDLTRI